LLLHRAKRCSGAEEGAGEISLDYLVPLSNTELVDWCGWTEQAGIVEENVDSTETAICGREQVVD
jgi:hypothetical protein